MFFKDAMSIALVLAAAAGCSQAAIVSPVKASFLPDDSGTPSGPAPAGARTGPGEPSNVCVTVNVDQRVWPTPLTVDSSRNFTDLLSVDLSRLHEANGGSRYIPGTNQELRFQSDHDRKNPFCRDSADDIYLSVSYSPKPDGSPFEVRYEVKQGDVARSGSFSRDIEDEWRTGLRPRIYKIEPLSQAVAEDIRARAAFFLELLNAG